ncbi:collagen alpha-1(III) chain-like [Camelus ferus]|uniref:Collagen alpha-1(III) chain-like n=1 Tax=Camelus ferus TaxID=419612 RepID=A0A8B8RWR2_CAMFR|nr:collagen alpha-1(III) chain-like [Camelus ferus]XP_032322388.1 collagen alpha-1(III) chain-like [Camelus ferus]
MRDRGEAGSAGAAGRAGSSARARGRRRGTGTCAARGGPRREGRGRRRVQPGGPEPPPRPGPPGPAPRALRGATQPPGNARMATGAPGSRRAVALGALAPACMLRLRLRGRVLGFGLRLCSPVTASWSYARPTP